MTAGKWFALFVLSVLWGSSYFFFQILADSLPPLTVVLGRVGIAALLLGAVLLAVGGWKPLRREQWRDFFVVALLSNIVPFTLTAWAEAHIPGGFASVLNATTPCFAIVVARLAGQDAITWNKVVGLGLGLVGVLVLVGPSSFEDGSALELPAIGAILLAALSYALAGVYGQRFHDLAPLQVATAQLAAGAAITLPFALVLEHPWTLAAPPVEALGALLGIAVIATALAYVLYYRILFAVGPTNLLLVTMLMPVTALALGILFLGERMTTQSFIGTVLIGFSLAAIDGRLLRRGGMRPFLARGEHR